MILIQRISNNAYMNDIFYGEWNKREKLKAEIEDRNNLPANTHPDVIARKNQAIDVLLADRELWETRRKDAVCKMFGGVPSDYTIIYLPPEEEADARKSRFIEDVDGARVYHTEPEYHVSGSAITVNPGWVKLNHRLIDADVTDFGGLSLTEPLYFALVYAISEATQTISVQLLTRAEDEEFGVLPPNLTRFRVICEGRVNLDNSITLSEVV